ncbi:hypothetical protein [Streptomyces apocyni]|uniref:hypothetical protein n=1 Tax=Streptomyces apocyni TaxID=2654677 RepID=UPI0012E9FEC3|nr:hypothetical protein [Streptomyces apocyni]
MQSSALRTLFPMVVPAAAVGVLAAVVSGVAVGGKGAFGAILGSLVVILFMGAGQVGLQYVAKAMPQLLQGMALMVYFVQLVILLVFILAVRNTTVFHHKAFALTLVIAVVVWIVAQALAQLKGKTLYVDPAAEGDSHGTGASREK